MFFSATSWADQHIGAIGFEAGIARLSDGKNSAIGQSWLFHCEYQIDPIIGFFGQAGKSEAKDGPDRFMQTAFNGGILIDVLPVLEFRVGIATTVVEIEDKDSTNKENELGPLAGLTAYTQMGIWKVGASAEVIKTPSLQTAAMRLMLLMMF